MEEQSRDASMGGLDREIGSDRSMSGSASPGADEFGTAGTANTPSFGATDGFDNRPSESGSSSDTGGAMQNAKDRAAGALSQAENQANRLMGKAAGGLENAANRIDHLADERLAGSGRAQDAAHRAAETAQNTGRYLRDHDVRDVQGDLERITRERPMQTVLTALAVGWVLGKIIR